MDRLTDKWVVREADRKTHRPKKFGDINRQIERNNSWTEIWTLDKQYTDRQRNKQKDGQKHKIRTGH
jgi:hypothetical protein